MAAIRARERLQVTALGVFRYFTRHRTAANLLLVLMLAAGLAAIPNMRAQFFPDVVVQNVSVSVAWQGAGAEDVDGAIVQVLEPTLLAVEGVTASSSRATEGSATITLEFEPGWDMARAASDVQDAIDLTRNLPDDAEDPRVRRSGWGDRVTDVVITGPVGIDQLGRFADEFVTRLFSEGVTRATIRGVAAPEIVVEVPSAALIRHDLGMAEIAQAIASEVSRDPAGEVSGGAARVRTGAERRTAEEIAAIVLRSGLDGSTLTIGDVATLHEGTVDRDRAYFVGQNSAITVRVDRSETGDAIAMQAQVQAVADELMLTLPEGVRVDLVRTRAEMISGRLAILINNGLMGLGLVVILLFLFLSARTAFWVSAGIPVAMLAAVAAMYAMGLSFNMISLFALIITLGIVVDDAIVVAEHADWRARELREGAAEAAENAATRMAQPVFAASITTIIAFLGLVAIGGRFGAMIADIPLTVVAVLIASLIECFLILPNHMYHALVGAAREKWYDWPSRQVNRGFRWVRERLFRPFMGFVIWARYPVLAAAVAMLALQGALLVRGDVPWRFFNSPEQGSITGNFAMTSGATRSDSLEMMRELQRATEALAARYEAEYGTNPLLYVLGELGGNTGRALSGAENKAPEQLGSIAIDLIDADFRPYSSFQFVSALQDEVRAHPRLEELSFRSFGSGPGGDSLSVDLFGASAEALKAAAEALKTALLPFPEISGIEDNLPYDKEELVLQLTPQGQALGFTVDGLARVLRNRLGGIEAATFPYGARSGAIRVELPEAELSADFLESTLLRSAAGQYLPLGDIVTVESRQGFSTVRRENGVRLVTVSGDLSEDDPARARDITLMLQNSILPQIEADHGVAFRLSGLAEQERDFLNDALMALIACLLAIYLVLAWVFSSWLRPLVVMAVIPFGLIGVVWGHNVMGMALTMFSVVGLLGMTGIIINDSIVLVTTVDQYARERGLLPSIVDAACDRLRPVLLTTLTTVLGLGPLLLEGSTQALFLKPTVITLVFGLGFGMVLVLLIVPALLAVGFDLSQLMRGLRRSLSVPPRARGLALVPMAAGLAMALLFALTLGHAALAGELPGFLLRLLPQSLADAAVMKAALGLFIAGSAAIMSLAWVAGGLGVWLATRRSAAES